MFSASSDIYFFYLKYFFLLFFKYFINDFCSSFGVQCSSNYQDVLHHPFAPFNAFTEFMMIDAIHFISRRLHNFFSVASSSSTNYKLSAVQIDICTILFCVYLAQIKNTRILLFDFILFFSLKNDKNANSNRIIVH